MRKGSQQMIQPKQKRDRTSTKNGSILATREEALASNALEDAFASFPDAILLCDREGKILRMNGAALQLFEVSSERQCRGVVYQQFLQHYEILDERKQRVPLGAWLQRVLLDEEDTPSKQEQLLLLGAPSGRHMYLNLRCSLVLDPRHHVVGMVSIFHEITHQYQKALHLQRVQEVVATLTKALAQLPEQMSLPIPGETLLSPPITFIAQQLVEVIGHVLGCSRLILVAFEPPTSHLSYVAGFGFTAEQEQQLRESRGRFLLSDIRDEAAISRLQAHQEAIVPSRRLSLPPWYPASFERGDDLVVPLFLEQQWVGVLGIVKDGSEHEYTQDEREVVQVVVAQAELVMECAHGLYQHAEAWNRALMLEEANHLSNDFLVLAAHELRTPLTGIKGNLQLAQRRLQTLKRQIAEQPEQLVLVQRSLGAATQGAQRQERMIQDMLDDACIQANHLEVLLKPCDLLILVEETVATWQQLLPERALLLDASDTRPCIPILADADRITRVLNRYLENALAASSPPQPVTVHVKVEGDSVRVSVHMEGIGIPAEEQARIWERSYRAKGSGVQHTLDLSLGLGLYLCRVFIERHHGHVGVQSVPGQGATFWFTLPLLHALEE